MTAPLFPLRDGERSHPRNQLSKHLDDTDEESAGTVSQPFVGDPSGAQQVEDGRTLSRATPGHRVEATLVRRRATPAALRDIEDDGNARAVELIAEFGATALGHELA